MTHQKAKGLTSGEMHYERWKVGLEYARGHYDSVYGRIEAGWEKTEDGYIYNVTVPANTSALFCPDGISNQANVTFLSGDKYATASEDSLGWNLPAGHYTIQVSVK